MAQTQNDRIENMLKAICLQLNINLSGDVTDSDALFSYINENYTRTTQESA